MVRLQDIPRRLQEGSGNPKTFLNLCPRSSGFTLLEILVVLVIVGLISGTLLQALGQIYRVQTRFGVQLAQSQEGSMYTDWFRQSIQGLQADYADGQDRFKGNEHQFQGLSSFPLMDQYGAIAPLSFELHYNKEEKKTTLNSVSGEKKLALFSWDGPKAGRFIYVDSSGGKHTSWPPVFGEWPQLPAMILLQYQQNGEPILLAATPRGSLEAQTKLNSLIKNQ